VVLDVLERGVLRQHRENVLNLLLRRFHPAILSRRLPHGAIDAEIQTGRAHRFVTETATVRDGICLQGRAGR
jgi:hypothetical protein